MATPCHMPRENAQNEVDNKVFLGKAKFFNKVFVFVIVFVLWMGKRGMEKDWVRARMRDVGVG
jgi:hypothetical protein